MEEYKHYMRPKGKGIKLHLGAGDYWFEGYINIDFNVYGGTDMLCDIRKPLPFQPHVVEVIQAHEVLEHMNKDELFNILEDWKRVLIPHGRVDITVPNIDKLIELYQVDKKNALQQIYGIEDHPHHKQGFTKETLIEVFLQHGYVDITCDEMEVENRPGEPKLVLRAHAPLV